MEIRLGYPPYIIYNASIFQWVNRQPVWLPDPLTAGQAVCYNPSVSPAAAAATAIATAERGHTNGYVEDAADEEQVQVEV